MELYPAMDSNNISKITLHPVQQPLRRNVGSQIRSEVTLAAYEVYSHIFQPQEAMITGRCRGGFGTGELICLLYARSFPKSEWRQRFHEAMEGSVNL